jgi:hypothetical protein
MRYWFVTPRAAALQRKVDAGPALSADQLTYH